MSYARIIRMNYIGHVARIVARVEASYERGREFGESRLQELVPRRSGDLAKSSKAIKLDGRVGFMMRSFGDDDKGKSYAVPVNFGHHTRNGGWVPPHPYFSQAVRDTEALLRTENKKNL